MRGSLVVLFLAAAFLVVTVPPRVAGVCCLGCPCVTVTPTTQSVSQGSVVTYSIDVAWGFPSVSFDLTVSGLPSGASYSFGANPVTTDITLHATTTLQIDASSTPIYCAGSYSFTVTATSGPNIGTSSPTALTVNQVGPPLQVSVSTDKTAYTQGQTITITVSATRPAEGVLQVTPPSGSPMTYPFSFTGVTYGATQTLTANAPYGTYTISVQADDYCNGVSSASTSFSVGPSTYDVSVQLSGLPPQYSASVQVDGQSQGTISLSKTLSFAIGSSHTVSVDQYVSGASGVRYYCAQNTWSVSSADSHTFSYQTQYQLTVTTDPAGVTQVSSGGWFNAGDTAQTSQAPQTVPGSTGVQYVFQNWSVDGTAQNGNQITVTMNGPHTAVAKYKTQYLLTVDSAGGLGNPQGGGYYDTGSTAQFSVTSPVGYLVQQVFVQWQGDYTGTSPQGSVTMNAPKTVTATWTTSYTNVYLAGGAVVALIVIGAILGMRRRGGKGAAQEPKQGEEPEKKRGLHLGKPDTE